MSKTAIVTGASGGIGLAIAEKLVREGYRVYGIGRNFEKEETVQTLDGLSGAAGSFIPVVLDLSSTDEMVKKVTLIDKSEEIAVLVNNAGVGYYGLHEQLDADSIEELVHTNLTVPMILTGLLLKSLKRNHGYVINISSHTARQANPHGCAYGATKAGLSSFSRSLFAEERKYGLHVVNIEPDMTATNLYRNSDFDVDEDVMAYLEPKEVAQAVMYALTQREGCNITDIALEPQINRIRRKQKN